MLKGKVLVAQGGGPTAVINESLVGVINEARKDPGVEHVYGARFGVSGIINEDFIDLTQETTDNLERVAKTPCSALGSTRDKPDALYIKEILKVLKAHDIQTFIYIGGNDSSATLSLIGHEAEAQNIPLRCVHIPKTIDNDLVINDHTPGYPSAARFVANAFAGVNLDNQALPGAYVGVVMGRHAGFLTAASTLARQESGDGPHLVYIPERQFDMNDFLSKFKETYDRLGRCVAAVSEGIRDADGNLLATQGRAVETDDHGNVQLSGSGGLADQLTAAIKRELKIDRVRGDTFGYLQRSFVGCVSEIDQREAREVGEKAVQCARWENQDGSITIRRTGNYSVAYDVSPLDAVAGKTRYMPDEFIDSSGTDVTEKFYLYLKPLLGNQMPDFAKLRKNTVNKML
jgi:6-phosphofructokinase 1